MTDGWLHDPVESGVKAGLGLYLHVPFCAHRCGYCDFATYADRDHLIKSYVAGLHTELQRVASVHDGRAITSVFVGGGTPTILEHDDLAGVMRRIASEFDIVEGAEVTVECNPETASVDLFGALVDAGVNRISMGAQSFAPHILKMLERGHDQDRPASAVEQAREAGIAEVNLDLIYGTPGERPEDWETSLRRALEIGTDHVSAYALTIHDNTSFGRKVNAGTMLSPDEDVQADRFAIAGDILGGAGFEHYELSNWARTPALRSDHNILYWRHGDYLAIGVGAHGHDDGHRWWAPRGIERWLEDVEAGRPSIAGQENLGPDERAIERLLLGLRLADGVHAKDLPPIAQEAMQDAVDAGLVTTNCGRLQCTSDKGWFLLDEAVRRLL
ncbi:MAG: putative oxygen-independent coproporphyrinogen III oxidase [Glaciecola sp.]|jgi:putative oxygen-independent coproporphyrinogen III oxidase